MTEPQELRSIDELFRNTFNNLPETPAESGWDVPSDHVWNHISDNVQPPNTGWSLKSIALLAGFAVTVAIGLYFAFSTTPTVEPNPVSNSTPIAAPAVQAESTLPKEDVAVVQPADVVATPSPQQQSLRNQNQPAEPAVASVAKPQVNSDENPSKPRISGAAPLPGTTAVKKPNTTEELKAIHAQRLEKAWKTPLTPLPVPRDKAANND